MPGGFLHVPSSNHWSDLDEETASLCLASHLGFYNALRTANPLSQRRPYFFSLLPDMLIRPTEMKATAKSR